MNKQPAHGAATETSLNTNRHIHNIVKSAALGWTLIIDVLFYSFSTSDTEMQILHHFHI